MTLTVKQRRAIHATVEQVCAHNKWPLHAVNVRTQHLHAVVTARKQPEQVMNSLKSWATRRMREQGLWPSEDTPWSRHGSTRYLWNEESVQRACTYVLHRQGAPY